MFTTTSILKEFTYKNLNISVQAIQYDGTLQSAIKIFSLYPKSFSIAYSYNFQEVLPAVKFYCRKEFDHTLNVYIPNSGFILVDPGDYLIIDSDGVIKVREENFLTLFKQI